MVAQESFDEPAGEATAVSVPSPPIPPPTRFRGRLLAAVTAVAITGGAGSGALAATLIERAAPPHVSTGATTPAIPATLTSTGTSATVQSIYQEVSPGVVTITTAVANRFRSVVQGTGSGMVLDLKGDILTNYHVIAGAGRIDVTFASGQTVPASVVGSSAASDLAIIRVTVAASSLHPLTLGNSDSVQVGDTVFAIGSPFGHSGSMTEGIISNLHQRGGSSLASNVEDLIQTSAAINPGNSGGPLVNSQGEVIGITAAIESPVDGNVGVGFVIPINQVKQLLSSVGGGSTQ